MNGDTQHEPEYRVLLQQLRGSSSNVYMTLLSIVQGVTLSDLASIVESNYSHFTLVNWLLVLAMLVLITAVWHLILIDAISLSWTPDLGDALLPFGIVICQLLLNHLIFLSLSLWLVVLAVTICLVEVVGGVVFVRWKAEVAADANRKLLPLLRQRQRPYLLHGLSGTVLFLFLGLFSLVAGVGAGDALQGLRGLLATGMAVLAIVWVASLLLTSRAYWHAVVAYARTGQMPDS